MKAASDVLIVGAGLVGLSLAAALSRSHLSVTVVDARAKPILSSRAAKLRNGYQLKSGVTPRVSAINPSSVKFLSRIGAWEVIAENRISTFKEMNVWDNRGTSHIEFGGAGQASPVLGHIVENQLIEIALIEVLEASGDVTFKWQSDLQEIVHQELGYAVHFVNGSKAECTLLVGADGGNSRVRELCGLRTVRWSYQQTALVTTVETELDHERTARQCFTNNGPLAFLPLADQRLCSVVWSVKHADELMSLKDQEFCELLTASFENRLGRVLGVDKRFTFGLQQQHALQYIDEQVVLIGDAAHTIHPLAGQGANLGFADANALAQVLAGARLEGKSIGAIAVLKSYQRRRQSENIVMASAMEFFKRLYDTDNPGINWVRNAGMRLVNSDDRLKSIISKLAAGR